MTGSPLWPCHPRTATDVTQMQGDGYVPITLYFQTQAGATFGPRVGVDLALTVNHYTKVLPKTI